MKILIVENYPPKALWGEFFMTSEKPPMEPAYEAFGSYTDVDEADIVLGTDENGECHVVKNSTGQEIETRTEMR